jgi:hypothetical protein
VREFRPSVFDHLAHERSHRAMSNCDVPARSRQKLGIDPTLQATALEACKLGLEGIVSKRRGSAYSSGRSPHWIKSKNPNAPAVKRALR